jgi:hypothetical protein
MRVIMNKIVHLCTTKSFRYILLLTKYDCKVFVYDFLILQNFVVGNIGRIYNIKILMHAYEVHGYDAIAEIGNAKF